MKPACFKLHPDETQLLRISKIKDRACFQHLVKKLCALYPFPFCFNGKGFLPFTVLKQEILKASLGFHRFP